MYRKCLHQSNARCTVIWHGENEYSNIINECPIATKKRKLSASPVSWWPMKICLWLYGSSPFKGCVPFGVDRRWEFINSHFEGSISVWRTGRPASSRQKLANFKLQGFRSWKVFSIVFAYTLVAENGIISRSGHSGISVDPQLAIKSTSSSWNPLGFSGGFLCSFLHDAINQRELEDLEFTESWTWCS